MENHCHHDNHMPCRKFVRLFYVKFTLSGYVMFQFNLTNAIQRFMAILCWFSPLTKHIFKFGQDRYII